VIQFDDIPAFAAHVRTMTANVDRAEEFALKLAGAMVTAEAKRVLGSYDYRWPQLQPDTQAAVDLRLASGGLKI
jgi:hypothetical protein